MSTHTETPRPFTLRPRTLGLAVIAAPLLVLGCQDEQSTGAEAVAELETIERIVEEPAKHYGSRTILAGEVEDVHSPRAFTIGGTDFFDHEILVLTRDPVPPAKLRSAEKPFWRDDIVQVSGTVRELVIADVEREIGWDLQPEIEAEFESKPVVVAHSVKISPRDSEAGAERTAAAEEAESDETTAALVEPIRDFTLIVAIDPVGAIMGKKVELSEMKVQSVVSDRGFWIGPSEDQQIFVRLDPEPKTPKTPIEGAVKVEAGQVVDIAGKVHAIPPRSKLEKDWGIDPSLADQVSDEPFYLVATEVDINERQRTAGSDSPRER